MTMLRNIALLCAVYLVKGQVLYDHLENGTGVDYDKIAKLIQTPLYRQDAPTASDPEEISSYLPQRYESEESSSSESIESKEGEDAPSMLLQPPKLEAESVYSIYAKLLEQQLPDFYIQPFAPYQSNEEDNPVSKQLDLPLPNTPPKSVAYPPIPATQLTVPIFEPYSQQFNSDLTQYDQDSKSLEEPLPTLSQILEVPKVESIKPQYAGVYPKKYNSKLHDYKPKKGGKKLPILEIIGDDVIDVSNAKYVPKPSEYMVPPAESQAEDRSMTKQRQKFEDAQQKMQVKRENELNKQQRLIDATLVRATGGKGEQLASATGFHSGAQYAAPIHHSPSVGLESVSHGGGGDRTEFQMYGQHGPHSYKFGYDTGEGKNRQFRYEERDNDGIVKGHYGFYDKHGKLQVVNYDAHPHHGFHAEGSFGKA